MPTSKKSKPATARTSQAALAERNLLAAGKQISEALALYEQAANEYQNAPTSALTVSPVMDLLRTTISAPLHIELRALALAIKIIETGQPIAPRSERGIAWTGLLDSAGLAHFAAMASPDDDDYLTQAGKAYEKYSAHQAERSLTCGRTGGSGPGCRLRPVYWPGRGRIAGCTRHLTAEEKAALNQAWSDVEAKRPCPGCTATPGNPCVEDAHALTPVNGEWPRIRSFAGRKMHDVRLQQSDS